MKQLWNVAAKKDTLWVKWISVEKLKGRNVLDITIEKSCSPMRKTLLGMRDKVKEHMWYELGDGKSIPVWYDKWNTVGPLSSILTKRDIYEARMIDKCTVAEAMEKGVWKLSSEWYKKYLVLKNVKSPILNETVKDKLRWIDNKGVKSDFVVSKVSKDFNEDGQNVIWKYLVWFNQCIPKHAFILWMALQERLLTQDRILK
ncbi:RNA-directed DNA polymerase, eukaryota, reverse transcriptase zinc-binding domain protein [Tanacetum coccineum]